MKKIILVLTITLLTTIGFAQEDCRIVNEKGHKSPPESIYETSKNETGRRAYPSPYVFNVRFHIVKNTNGTGVTQNYGEAELMNAMKILNTTYNPFLIYFKYKGFDVIQNSTYMKIRSSVGGAFNQNTTHPLFNDLVSYSKTMTNPVYDYSAMNLFILEKIDESTTTLQTQTAGVANLPGVNSAFSYNSFLTSTLPHEIGHNFNVLHTHQGSGGAGCELVNGSNSSSAGDLVADTPASYSFSSSNVNTSNCTFVQSNPPVLQCNSTTIGTPAYGSGIHIMPIKNFMSTNNSCRTLGALYSPGNAHFTVGQGERMRTTIAQYINVTTNPYGFYNAKTTVASLYQPFSVVNLANGFQQHRFQKGFTYKFPNNNLPDPLTATTNDIPLNANYTIDYPVRIYEVNTSALASDYQYVSVSLPPTSIQNTDNQPYFSGRIVSSNQLGSNNYTTRELDEQQANDATLLQNLSPNEYHIITKERKDGTVEQQILYKK